MMINCRCRGVCRCEHKYKLCATAYAENVLDVPCPQEDGCPVTDIQSSQLQIYCPCCRNVILDVADVFELNNCKPCRVNLDLTDMNVFGIDTEKAGCDFRYRLYVNGNPYLAGVFVLDFSFAP